MIWVNFDQSLRLGFLFISTVNKYNKIIKCKKRDEKPIKMRLVSWTNLNCILSLKKLKLYH